MVYGCQAKGVEKTPALPPETVTPIADGPRSQGQVVWMSSCTSTKERKPTQGLVLLACGGREDPNIMKDAGSTCQGQKPSTPHRGLLLVVHDPGTPLSRPVVLNLWVMTPSGVEWPFQGVT